MLGLSLITRAMLAPLPALPPALQEPVREAVALRLRQLVARAPSFLYFALLMLTPLLALWLGAALLWARLISLTEAQAVECALAKLEKLHEKTASVVRLFRGLAAFCYYDHPLVQKHFGYDDARARQQEFRARFAARARLP